MAGLCEHEPSVSPPSIFSISVLQTEGLWGLGQSPGFENRGVPSPLERRGFI